MFVESLLMRPTEAGPGEIQLRYDEDRALTVTSDGEPFVETTAVGETRTLTEVRGEHDDKDEEPSTFTFVQSEGADWTTGDGASVGESRRTPWAGTVTFTKAVGEADDADELDALSPMGTKTGVAGESDDLEICASTATGTRVADEQGDRD
jgi:hypothetical protein